MSVAICGANPLFPPTGVGCGKPIESIDDLYRCTDCKVPFHRICAVRHFEDSDRAPIEVNWKRTTIELEERSVRMMDVMRRLVAVVRRVACSDAACDCMRCSAIRAFGRLLARDAADHERNKREVGLR